jgi:hypothetical protein
VTRLGAPTRVILELTAEDRYGVWELAWRLASARLAVPGAEAIALARTSLQTLVDAGLIEFETEDSAGVRKLDSRSAVELLMLDDAWHEPKPGSRLLYAVATERGRTEYVGETAGTNAASEST